MNKQIKKELMLSQRHLQTIPIDIINQYKECLECLNLSHNRILSFEWIYEFKNLKHLILDCNRLDETHLQKIFKSLQNISVLMLNKNMFSDLNNTATLLGRVFPNLKYLSLHGNPICPDGLYIQPFSGNLSYEYDFYKSRLLISLPKLKFLDHFTVQNSPIPLPACTQQRVGYNSGQVRRLSISDNRYSGTDSQGNRFISNSDL